MEITTKGEWRWTREMRPTWLLQEDKSFQPCCYWDFPVFKNISSWQKHAGNQNNLMINCSWEGSCFGRITVYDAQDCTYFKHIQGHQALLFPTVLPAWPGHFPVKEWQPTWSQPLTKCYLGVQEQLSRSGLWDARIATLCRGEWSSLVFTHIKTRTRLVSPPLHKGLEQ